MFCMHELLHEFVVAILTHEHDDTLYLVAQATIVEAVFEF